jgi:hypothetical protein
VARPLSKHIIPSLRENAQLVVEISTELSLLYLFLLTKPVSYANLFETNEILRKRKGL